MVKETTKEQMMKMTIPQLKDMLFDVVNEREGCRNESKKAIRLDELYLEIDTFINETTEKLAPFVESDTLMWIEDDLTVTEMLEIIADQKLTEDLVAALDNDGYCVNMYDSIEKLGSEAESDIRDENDSDYEFGMFLISAYKDGASNMIYHLFSTGKALAAEMAA